MRHVQPPHLPAADLGLTDDELHALLWVTERLEDGRIEDSEFDMHDEISGCIGTHMERHLGCEPVRFFDRVAHQPIEKLFFPPHEDRVINGELHAIHHPGWTAGPTTAARACRQFLQTGAVDWDAVIEGAV